MKVLVYGGNGWIGSQFCTLLKNRGHDAVVATARANDIVAVNEELASVGKVTHVVSMIGRTHGPGCGTIDYLEQPGKLKDNVRDNLQAPITLALACQAKGIHFTYLGTGCIFEYDKEDHERQFNEADKPNFFGSSYSVVKGITDELMHGFNDSVLNLRIRMPITASDNPRNFITKITSYEYICSIENSMSVLPTLLPIVFAMMGKQMTGTVNLVNPGVISHNEILQMYKEIVDPGFTWKNFTVQQQDKVLAARRSNNHLDTSLLEAHFPDVPRIDVAVRQCLEQMAVQRQAQKEVVVVTGGSGFIGSHFINQLFASNQRCEIVNLDAMHYCADNKRIAKSIRSASRYHFYQVDISNTRNLEQILEPFFDHISYVVHFAAQSHVQNSFSDAMRYTKDNVVGTHSLLEVIRKNVLPRGCLKKFIHVSTDEVYGESTLSDAEEKKSPMSVLAPTNPYAATKAGAELIAQSYITSFQLPIIITRGNNVYGPNQYPEKLIPKFIQQLLNGSKVTVQGDGSNVRGFLHVDDTVQAFLTIMKHGQVGTIYNIGCEEDMEYTVHQVAEMLIKKIHGPDACPRDWITYIEDRPFNDKRYFIDNNLLRGLGWKPTISFVNGLNSVVEHHKQKMKTSSSSVI